MTTTTPQIRPGMTVFSVIEAVSAVTGVSPAEITGPRRTNRICFARFLTMAGVRIAFPWWALIDVSQAVGRGDHATIYHGLCRYRTLFDTDKHFRNAALTLGLPQIIP